MVDDHLVSWGPSGLLFNCTFADRTGANHGDVIDSSETQIFTAFWNNFSRILQELAECGGKRLSTKCFLGLISVTVLKYNQERCLDHWHGCLLDVTDAMSDLLSFFIDF